MLTSGGLAQLARVFLEASVIIFLPGVVLKLEAISFTDTA
jgi:hypothetical protein